MAIQKGKKDPERAQPPLMRYALLAQCTVLALFVGIQVGTPLYALETRLLASLILPIEHGVTRIAMRLPGIATLGDVWSAQQQIEALRREKEALLREVVMLRSTEDELNTLKTTVNTQPQHTEIVMAPLVQYPRSQILRGTSDGIVTGNPVFSSKGLIGVVGDVTQYSASLHLLTSDTIRLPVMHQASKVNGMLTAQDGQLFVTFMALIPSVQPGDVVVTLPTKEGIVAGELIGTVSSIDTKLSDPVTKVRVQSSVFPVLDTTVVVVKGGS